MLNKIIIFIFVIFFSVPVFGGGENEIEWAISKFAIEYLIEVRDYKTKIVKVTKRVGPKVNKYKVDSLKEGLYEYRVAVITSKKETLYTEWSPLSVQLSLEPEGAIDEFYFASLKEKNQEIFITGKNFVADTKIEVFNKDSKIPVKTIVVNSSEELKFVLDLTTAKQGRYDLRIINPLGKTFEKPDFFIVDYKLTDAENKAKKVERDDKIKKFGTEDKTKATLLARSYFLRSMIFPGWGQYAAGIDMNSKAKKWRGGIYMGLAVISIPLFAYSYRDYRGDKNDVNSLAYQNSFINQPFNFPLSLYGTKVNNDYNDKVDELQVSWQNVNRVGFFFAGLYTINLIDAYFFTGRKRGIFTVMNEVSETNLFVTLIPERNPFGQMGNAFDLTYSIRF